MAKVTSHDSVGPLSTCPTPTARLCSPSCPTLPSWVPPPKTAIDGTPLVRHWPVLWEERD